MAKIKKISVNAFERVMKEIYIPTVTIDWHGVEVTVKKTLSVNEVMAFVDMVVKTCFTVDTNAYMPEVKDFAIKTCVLEKYANFTMPSSVEKQYALIYCTDAFEHILEHINQNQFSEICIAIEKKIENLAQANIEAVNKQMNELYNAFDNLQTHLSTVFGDVGENDVRAVVDAISNGALDEEKLIRAYANIKSGNEDGGK